MKGPHGKAMIFRPTVDSNHDDMDGTNREQQERERSVRDLLATANIKDRA